MRILHLIPRYYPARGGAELHIGEFSRRLAAAGHRVTVATTNALSIEYLWSPARPSLKEPQELVAGVLVRRFPVEHLPLSPLSYAATRRLLWLLSGLSAPVPLLERLARATPRVPSLWRWLDSLEDGFDLVAGMSITFEPLLAAGLRFARRHDLPFITYPLTHLGSGPRPGEDSLSRFYTMKHQVALVRASQAAIMQTPSERAFYEARGIPRQHLPVVGPGVTPGNVLGGNKETVDARYRPQGPVVFALGTMCYDKGTMHVVEAVQQLWQRQSNVELFLAGAILEPFQRYLDNLPPAIRERIHVLGQIDEQEKRDLLAACDIFVLPSRTDSFGIVYLEAWLYGKPVIAADTWGVKDVISHEQDGLLVPFGDVPALAAAISRLLAHPEQAAAMGRRGKKKVLEQHTWEQKYRQIEKIYEDLAT